MCTRLSAPLLAAILIGVLGIASGQDATPQPINWWKLDEDAGNAAADSAEPGHPGELTEGLSFEENSAPGRDGGALALAGEGALMIPDYEGIAGTAQRTVAAWVKTTETQGEVISWGENDFGRMWTLCFIRGRLGISPKGGYLYVNAPINNDEWHHVAATIEEAELPNLHDDVKLYLDGEPAEIHDIGLLDLWPVDTGSGQDVMIGRGFKGQIDDVRIYDVALSVEEIRALFDSY